MIEAPLRDAMLKRISTFRVPFDRTAVRHWPKAVLHSVKTRAVILCLVGLGQFALADAAFGDDASFDHPADRVETRRVTGRLMLDYSSLTLTNGGAFDLMSLHYLQQTNDWLSFGVGAFAPIARGNYGGFYGADATLHAQRRIVGNWFVNAGLSVGAGAGGSSVSNIRALSGEGLFARAYAGVGYTFRNLSVGVNFSRVAIAGSQINDSAISLFVQRPLAFSVGSYADAGSSLSSAEFDAPEQENIISFQFNNVSQINPTGSYRGNIGVVSAQFTHFLNNRDYTFFGIDIGVSGLQWYNQAHGGIGRRFSLSPRLSLYGQVGLGSGGWVTDTFDTGPGFIIYPKVSLEYLWSNGIGATLSAGYLYAPFGTSRNWTVGLGLNYHLSRGNREANDTPSGADYTLRGVRLNVFGRRTSRIFYNGRESDGLNLIAVQADYALNDHWYLSGQIAAATNSFRSYAGYAEGFVGLGWQSNTSRSGRWQGYAQLMYGLNDVGVDARHEVGALLYPAVGLNYHVNNRISVYGQLGATISLGQYTRTNFTNSFENYSLGLGVTYRFSLPTRS